MLGPGAPRTSGGAGATAAFCRFGPAGVERSSRNARHKLDKADEYRGSSSRRFDASVCP